MSRLEHGNEPPATEVSPPLIVGFVACWSAGARHVATASGQHYVKFWKSPKRREDYARLGEQRLCLIMLHRLVARRDVEADESAYLYERQNAPPHQFVDMTGAALEMPRDFCLVNPLSDLTI
jgi:hypothetical protein